MVSNLSFQDPNRKRKGAPKPKEPLAKKPKELKPKEERTDKTEKFDKSLLDSSIGMIFFVSITNLLA